MKPFLKWAGGKFRIVDRIRAALPTGRRLVEPFAGSGAVFLNTDYEEYLIADSNADLINVFRQAKTGGAEFARRAKSLFVPENNQKDAFYRLRADFNNTSDLEYKAAVFIYLNRHCFNGLCRYNSKGIFNVPFGRYNRPTFPEAELANFSLKSQRCEFMVSDFRTTMKSAQRGDVIYCDPPYVPLTATANFTDYTAGGFGAIDQQELADLANELNSRGVPVVISNHDTKFTRLAYSSASIEAFDVQRFISRDASNRSKAAELLAVFV